MNLHLLYCLSILFLFLFFVLILKVVLCFEQRFWDSHIHLFGHVATSTSCRGELFMFWNLSHAPVLIVLLTGVHGSTRFCFVHHTCICVLMYAVCCCWSSRVFVCVCLCVCLCVCVLFLARFALVILFSTFIPRDLPLPPPIHPLPTPWFATNLTNPPPGLHAKTPWHTM